MDCARPIHVTHTQVALQQQLQEQVHEARQLQERLSTAQAARQDAALAVQAEEQEVGTLQSQVTHQQALVVRKTRTARDLERFAQQARWCDRLREVLAMLGGVELSHVDEAQHYVQLVVRMAVPLHFVPAGSVAGMCCWAVIVGEHCVCCRAKSRNTYHRWAIFYRDVSSTGAS